MKGFGNPTDASALCRLTQHVFATYTSKHAPVVAETLRPMMQKLCFFLFYGYSSYRDVNKVNYSNY